MAKRVARPGPAVSDVKGVPPGVDLSELAAKLVDAAESLREIGLALGDEPNLRTLGRQEPADAVAALKAYLPDERLRIQLQDLMDAVTQGVVQNLRTEDLGMGVGYSVEEVDRRLKRYDEITTPLARLLAVGGYWGSTAQAAIWSRAIHAVGNAIEKANGLVVWQELRLLPATMLLYAAGVGAVAAGNLGTAFRILREPKVREPIATQSAGLVLVSNAIVTNQLANAAIESLQRHYTPGSDLIHDWLRPLTSDLILDDEEYSEFFDRWEYLAGVAYLDLSGGERFAPVGRISWRRRYYSGVDFGAEFLRDLDEQGRDWAPLQVGMFGRDPDVARKRLQRYAEIVSSARSTVF